MEAIDTAEIYGTEDLVGGVVRSCRERAFPVGKVLPENADCAGAKRACEAACAGSGRIAQASVRCAGRAAFRFPRQCAPCAELQRGGEILQWRMGSLGAGDMQNVLPLPCGSGCAYGRVLYNAESRGSRSAALFRGAFGAAFLQWRIPLSEAGGRCAAGCCGNRPPALRYPCANHVGMGGLRQCNSDSESRRCGTCRRKFPQPQCGAENGGFARHWRGVFHPVAKNSSRRLVGLARPPKLRFARGKMPPAKRPQTWAKWRVCSFRIAAAFRRRQSRSGFGRFVGSGRRYRTCGRGWTAASPPSSVPRSGWPSGSSSTGTFFHLPPTFATIIL